MYTVGAIGLLVILEAAELEMGIVKYMTNCLNSIVSYKFDSLYIYYNHCKLCNYYNLYICHNNR